MRLRAAQAALLAWSALWAPGVLASPESCPTPAAGANQLEQGAVRASWSAEPALAVSQPFVLRIGLCPVRAELIRVDATMPEHRHGMNYRVRLTQEAAGKWKAEGLVWHMPGRWELLLVVRLDGREQRLTPSVMLR